MLSNLKLYSIKNDLRKIQFIMEDNPPKADTVHILNLSGFTKPDRFGYNILQKKG
jgi:hypothetical protein